MPTFSYKAKNDAGAVVSGTLVADSEQAAVSSLDRLQLFPLELAERSERAAAAAPVTAAPAEGAGTAAGGEGPRALLRFRRGISVADTALFSRQLADLLKAGINLNRALGTLTRQTSNPRFAGVIAGVQADIAAGEHLADALQKRPEAFSPLYVNMVRAGEMGGFLEEVLHRAALFAEKELELRGRVTGALIYPALLIVLGLSAVGFLLVFFIPRFALIFKDLGGELPGITRAMLALSGFLGAAWWAIGIAAGLAAVLFVNWRKTPHGRLAFDRFRLRLPLLGDVIRKTAIARFTRTLGALLKSGVPILTAIDISKDALGNAVLVMAAAEAGAAVKEGRSLSEPLGRSPHFPPVVVDMIAVGDEGGNLDDVLLQIADAYDREVDRAVKLFVSLLEPALLVFMAAVVGLIVVSMLLPIFSLNSMIK